MGAQMDYLHSKDEAARFLQVLDPDAREFLFVEIGSQGARQHYTSLEGVWSLIERCNHIGGSNWFATINRTAGDRRTAEEVKAVRALFIDCDTPESVGKFGDWGRSAPASARPSIIVKSSAGSGLPT
jgi:hypothetical protein